jgi:hypothetical protein
MTTKDRTGTVHHRKKANARECADARNCGNVWTFMKSLGMGRGLKPLLEVAAKERLTTEATVNHPTRTRTRTKIE